MTNVFSSVDDDRLREAFSALTAEDGEQHRPFRWQMRLLRRLIDADPPKAVDIPTGLGKTSVMALWLLALAEGANLPRRLVYVVDRRAVVDQATRFAKRLRRNLLDELADRLRLREGTRGLPISTLRGGFADNRDWLEDPSKPAIVVGTIDMVGSRLLFEGYGISRGMRPYHASFLGVDSLVLLDEAHLCPPFEALLRQVAVHRDGKLGPSPDASTMTPPFRLMSLSATGREARELSASVFKLEEQDREESVVLQRLTARKRLKVIELADQEKSLTDCIAKRAIELGGGDTPARLLVYCNSRKDAVDVKTLVDEKCKELAQNQSSRHGPPSGGPDFQRPSNRAPATRVGVSKSLLGRCLCGFEASRTRRASTTSARRDRARPGVVSCSRFSSGATRNGEMRRQIGW